MRHPARYLALAACLALTGSVADAAPGRRHGKATRKARHRAKVAPAVDRPTAIDVGRDHDAVDVPATAGFSGSRSKGARTARAREEAESETDRVAFAPGAPEEPQGDQDDVELRDTPVKLRKVAANRAKDWHVAIGPYLWASSVDADVSLGSASVGSGVDFIELQRHARYGAEVLAEARYGQLSVSTDFMYGVVDVNGDKTVGPLMVSLNGTASSLLVDGAAGYMLTGGDHSLLSLEARAGVRYQRTKIEGSVGIGGSEVASTEQVAAGADAIAGARVFVRPFNRFYVSSSFDLGVFGASSLTWSASADASVRVTSRVLLSVGWRTLTMDRANVSLVMHGPRAAVQLLF